MAALPMTAAFRALWLVLGCHALAPLSPEVERLLGAAAHNLTTTARRFERLRKEMTQVPTSTMERLLAGLNSSEVDLLRGQGHGKILEDRFEELQRQGRSLLRALRCDENASAEDDGFSLLEIPQEEDHEGDGEDERSEEEDEEDEDEVEDEEDSEVELEPEELEEVEQPEEDLEEDAAERLPDVLEDNEPMDLGSCRPPQNVSGYVFTELSLHRENFSVQAECRRPSFTGVAEVIPCEAHLQDYQLHGCVGVARCNPAEETQGYVITEASLFYQDFDVSAACADGYRGEAKVLSCDVPGEPYRLGGCSRAPACGGNWSEGKVQHFIQRLQSLAQDLTQHWELLTSLSNVTARIPVTPSARKALEQLQALRAAAQDMEHPRRQGALEALRRLGAAAARLDARSLEAQEDFEAIARELQSWEAAQPARSSVASRGLSLSCNLEGVQRANERFDEAVGNFRDVLPKMLPREVESLHRVLHSLEVLRHTLQALPESADCQRYFSGVEQLESDLAHYRTLFSPSDAPGAAGAAGAAAAPAPRKAVAVPLRPGQLEPLELDLGRGPVMNRPPVGVGPALDARGFR